MMAAKAGFLLRFAGFRAYFTEQRALHRIQPLLRWRIIACIAFMTRHQPLCPQRCQSGIKLYGQSRKTGRSWRSPKASTGKSGTG
jgi:hypothetical protein